MKIKRVQIKNIPVIIWGDDSDKAYIFVHGKMSNKESAEPFAEIAAERGYQTISFDLPEHGQRSDSAYKCDIFNGIADLEEIAGYAFDKWDKLSLYGCSLGAFFSLCAFEKRKFERSLFQSPIVNMEYLIHKMFEWFGVTEEALQEKLEIETPVDVLSWRYYQYVRSHPVKNWSSPTRILYAGKDRLQSRAVIKEFADKFSCELEISENSDHPFMDEGDKKIIEEWLKKNI